MTTPNWRHQSRPLTAERALFLLIEQAIERHSAKANIKTIGGALVDDIQHEVKEDRAKELI